MIEAAVLERVPAALVVKQLLNHRFGPGTKSLVEELKDQYEDKRKRLNNPGLSKRINLKRYLKSYWSWPCVVIRTACQRTITASRI